jgi:hypothetical protein
VVGVRLRVGFSVRVRIRVRVRDKVRDKDRDKVRLVNDDASENFEIGAVFKNVPG